MCSISLTHTETLCLRHFSEGSAQGALLSTYLSLHTHTISLSLSLSLSHTHTHTHTTHVGSLHPYDIHMHTQLSREKLERKEPCFICFYVH